MASLTMTLDEKDLTDAISTWLRGRGLTVKGTITINHYPANQREPSSTTVSVQVEPTLSPSSAAYDR